MFINWVKEGGLFPRVRTALWWFQLGLCGQLWRWPVETRLGSDLKGPANRNIGCEIRLVPGSRRPSVPGISQFIDRTSHCLMYLVRCLHGRVYSSRHRVSVPFLWQADELIETDISQIWSQCLSSSSGTLKSLIYSRWTQAFNHNGSMSLNSLSVNTWGNSVPLTLLLVLVRASSRQPLPPIHRISQSYVLPQPSLSLSSQEMCMHSSGRTANKDDSNK